MKVKIGEPQSFAGVEADGNLHPLLEGVSFENNDTDTGVKVIELLRNSSAAYYGLRPGDVIIGTNQRRVDDLRSFKQALKLKKDSVLLQVNRNGGSLFMVIR